MQAMVYYRNNGQSSIRSKQRILWMKVRLRSSGYVIIAQSLLTIDLISDHPVPIPASVFDLPCSIFLESSIPFRLMISPTTTCASAGRPYHLYWLLANLFHFWSHRPQPNPSAAPEKSFWTFMYSLTGMPGIEMPGETSVQSFRTQRWRILGCCYRGAIVNKSAIFESKFMTSGVERLVELAVGLN